MSRGEPYPGHMLQPRSSLHLAVPLLLLGLVAGGCTATTLLDSRNPLREETATTTTSPSQPTPLAARSGQPPHDHTQAGGDTPITSDAVSAGGTSSVRRPSWLGTRVLPRRPDGFGEVRPTPPELQDRRFASLDLLPPPHDHRFDVRVQTVPGEVARRSTWHPQCPVALEDLRYVMLTYWGFDERPHTGELLVHAAAAEDLIRVFRRLYAARFPIEEMRVVSSEELRAAPTGDGNNTTSFACRPTTGGTTWSEHAYGLAVDINPFHNPYLKGDLVLPELATAYTKRSWRRAGMIAAGDEVTESFATIGWGWGGAWRSAKDWMHFSRSGL
ncbi:MAG: M15 family metallopeptidase [Nitriliruptorales bacterium]